MVELSQWLWEDLESCLHIIYVHQKKAIHYMNPSTLRSFNFLASLTWCFPQVASICLLFLKIISPYTRVCYFIWNPYLPYMLCAKFNWKCFNTVNIILFFLFYLTLKKGQSLSFKGVLMVLVLSKFCSSTFTADQASDLAYGPLVSRFLVNQDRDILWSKCL